MKDEITESFVEDLIPGGVCIVGCSAEDGEFDFYIEEIFDSIEIMVAKKYKKVLCWLSTQCMEYAKQELPEIAESIPNEQVSLELFDANKYNIDDILDKTLEYYSMIDVLVADCNGIIDYSKQKKSNKNLEAIKKFAKEINIPVLVFIPDK